ncbi:FAD-binding oxidoreductase [Mycobacterium sp.]|uniref:FAD-binding oxidoreductase n=1 Tax=Mycobacterium sp. TaxID=1785 RepID=UPI002BD5B84D|nr:FAD-linked oxidase C-terminal domain-containing protein [Mycobacterium sp.]HTQ18140.1 FAD-linked oxidase C-terminal domain-containing protein [Mycobacterium sp.]
MDDAIIATFTAALSGPDAVATDPGTLAESGRDYWGFGGVPGLLLRPGTREEIVAVVRIAAEHQIPLVTRGGASNCAGAMMPNPGRVLVDLSMMNRVLDVDPVARTARVQPGVINADLQAQVAPHGLCFSPDPVSAQLATVGGNIIENAGGPHALKYGVTYSHVLSIEVVLCDGTVIQLSAADQGPDLLGVLIGSEGTLGILTEATVALRPIASVTRSLMGSFATAHDAAETISDIIRTGTVPAAVEWLDRAGIAGLQRFADTGYPTDVDAIVLIDIDGTAEQVDRDTEIVEQVLRRNAVEVRRADDEESRAKLWYGRLHAPDAVVRSGKGFFIGDVTVPRQHIPEMQEAIQAAAARHSDGLLFIAVTGHAGDGDLHPTTFFDRGNPKAAAALEAANNEIIEAALKLGGTITGEHGVGTEKRQFMTKRFTPVEIAAQRVIKRVFDPAALFNPGIMLPDPSPDEPVLASFEAALQNALAPYRRAAVAPVTQSTPAANASGRQFVVNTANLSLVVGAAVSLDDLSRQLAEHGASCPAIPDDATERSVGELIADASGPERVGVRHGLLGLEVVLPDGQAPARFGGENMKDVAGYDTKRLFIGGRGAFGAISTAIFKISIRA